MYRAAIIGAGGIAYHHATFYARNPNTRIVAAAEIRPQALAEFCDKHDLSARYGDYRELLAQEKPDLVSICTWTPTHPEIAVAAAEAGVRGILCEKPMGAHLGDARRMVARCAELGVPLVVDHQRRASPPFVAARHHILDGAIGRPLYGISRSTGGMLNNTSHAIDCHRFLVGDPEPLWVMAQLERRTNRYERGVLCEDRISGTVRFANGYTLAFESDMDDQADPGWWILGSEGTLWLEGDRMTIERGGQREPLAPEPCLGPLECLISWVESGPVPANAAHKTLAAHEIMMAAYESARTRTRVALPLPAEIERSPLYVMDEEGMLPVTGEPYDIRSIDALRYQFQRQGRALTGKEHLEGEGAWSGQGLPGQTR